MWASKNRIEDATINVVWLTQRDVIRRPHQVEFVRKYKRVPLPDGEHSRVIERRSSSHRHARQTNRGSSATDQTNCDLNFFLHEPLNRLDTKKAAPTRPSLVCRVKKTRGHPLSENRYHRFYSRFEISSRLHSELVATV